MNYLEMHKIPITKGEGKDKRWCTRLPDNTKRSGYRMVRKQTREEVEQEVIRYYKDLEMRVRPKPDEWSTVNDYFFKWLNYKKRNKELQSETFRKYENDYRRYLKDTDFSKLAVKYVDYIDIESFLADTAESLNLKTKAVVSLSGYLKGMFKLAVRDRLITVNPFDAVDLKNSVYPLCCKDEKRESQRILTEDEVKRLFTVLKKRHTEYPLYMPDYGIEICLWSGLRVGEVSALEWSDIKGDALYITKSERRICHRSKADEYVIGDTKNHKERVIPIGDELSYLLRRIKTLQEENGIISPYILADKNGRVFSHHISNAMYRRGKEAEIEAPSIHQIRRTVSSRLNTVYDRATVSHIMGHTEQVNAAHYDYDVVVLKDRKKKMDELYKSVTSVTKRF